MNISVGLSNFWEIQAMVCMNNTFLFALIFGLGYFLSTFVKALLEGLHFPLIILGSKAYSRICDPQIPKCCINNPGNCKMVLCKVTPQMHV